MDLVYPYLSPLGNRIYAGLQCNNEALNAGDNVLKKPFVHLNKILKQVTFLFHWVTQFQCFPLLFFLTSVIIFISDLSALIISVSLLVKDWWSFANFLVRIDLRLRTFSNTFLLTWSEPWLFILDDVSICGYHDIFISLGQNPKPLEVKENSVRFCGYNSVHSWMWVS